MLTRIQKEEIHNYVLSGKSTNEIKILMNIHGRAINDYIYYERKTGKLPEIKEQRTNTGKREIAYTLRIGDILTIKEGKEEVNEYILESIPKHKRFVVCRRLIKNIPSPITKTFTELELSKQLVKGGVKRSYNKSYLQWKFN